MPFPLITDTGRAGLDQIRAMPGEKFPEFKFGIDENFTPCDFYDKKVWSRGAADLVIKKGKECIIFDYKTGKRKPSISSAIRRIRLCAVA